MPGSPAPVESPLPPHVAWFAPWRWSPLKRRVMAGLLIAAVAYPLSIGPVAALAARDGPACQKVAFVYRPVLFMCWRLPGAMQRLMSNYLSACAGEDWAMIILYCHARWESPDIGWGTPGTDEAVTLDADAEPPVDATMPETR